MTALDNVCEVCNLKVDRVSVAASSVGAMSAAFCDRCLQEGAEPWGVLVGTNMGLNKHDVPKELLEIIKTTCRVVGKTEVEFWAACKEAEESYIRYCEENES